MSIDALQGKRPTISACMIVKNEEKALPDCLKSIRDHVGEIIVVDTGSADNTVHIADSFEARVFHHPWEDHFSKHRNQSIEYARGEWILIIDADEELIVPRDLPLSEVIQVADDIDALTFMVECPFGANGATACNNSIRLFRNHRGIHYEGRVHNYLVGIEKATFTTVRIFHHGFDLDRPTMRRKFERTTSLLKKDLAENPENPRPHHFLAASYLSEGMYREAAKEAQEAMKLYEKENQFSHNYLWSLYMAASAHLGLGDVQMAEELAKKGIEINPNHLDSHYMMASIAFQRKDRDNLEKYASSYSALREAIGKDPSRFGQMVHNTYASQWILYFFQALLLHRNGQSDQAECEFEKSRTLCPDLSLYYTKTGAFHMQDGEWGQAEKFLQMALEMHPEDTQAMWLLSHVHEKLNQPGDQVRWIEKILKMDPEFLNAPFRLGLALMKLSDFHRALELFQGIRAQEPENRLAAINEALCLRGLGRYQESLERSLSIETRERDEISTIVSNVAHNFEAMGQTAHAVEWFQKMADIDPSDPLPPVYLSKLYLEMKQIEPCVAQCDRLLTLLCLDNNRVLNSLKDLGELYRDVGSRLQSRNRPDLGEVCFQVARGLEMASD